MVNYKDDIQTFKVPILKKTNLIFSDRTYLDEIHNTFPGYFKEVHRPIEIASKYASYFIQFNSIFDIRTNMFQILITFGNCADCKKTANNQFLNDSNISSNNSNIPTKNTENIPQEDKAFQYFENKDSGQDPNKSINVSSKESQSKKCKIITVEQLMNAMQENGFNPPIEHLNAIVQETNDYFDDSEMAAMFLGQLAHESGGFVHREEIGYENGQNTFISSEYGAHGKSYHGRGFIQLSHPENYKLASHDLGYGDLLWKKPEMVSEDIKLSAKVSIWYWKTRVMEYPGVKDKKLFGLTTKSINGVLECNGQNIEKSKRRYILYKSIAKYMGIVNLAEEGGCY